MRRKLFFAHSLAALDVLGIGPAQSQMARRVLVVQSVEEENARLRHRRVIGYQRYFAQIGGSLVVAQQLRERVFPLSGTELDGLSVLEAQPEAVDDLALVVQRLRRVRDSVYTGLKRHAEALLSRHIRVKIHPARRCAPAADPDVVLYEFYFYIRSDLTGKMQFHKSVRVHLPRMLDQFFVMQVPLGNRIIVFRDPCHSENRVSEFLESLFFRQVGEHYFGPLHRRHADHTPLPLIVHSVTHKVRHFRVISHIGGLDLLAVHAGHDPGLVRQDRDIAGAVVMLYFGLVIFPLRHLGQHFFALVLVCHPREVAVVPLDAHISGPGLIRALHDLFHESRVLHVRPYYYRLVLLNIYTFAHHELRQFVVHFFCYQNSISS